MVAASQKQSQKDGITINYYIVPYLMAYAAVCAYVAGSRYLAGGYSGPIVSGASGRL